ncbi:MAG: YigZ family protein [Spirochaetales bacterium]|nr:YigZ family protein [Spirochaetales bacterium]
MLVPTSSSQFEISIKNSKFIAIAQRIETREEAKLLIESQWRLHPGARHIVYAFAIGKNREILGASDDGEPSGTAGMPTLEVLKGAGITNCIIMIIRYFGGTKLGTGGLVKAYGESAKGVLESLTTEELIEKSEVTIGLEYTHLKQIKILLSDNTNISISEESFTDHVTIKALIPATDLDEISKKIADISCGEALFEITG